jgi:glycosyltransferase involved in cell wall biosynthesis
MFRLPFVSVVIPVYNDSDRLGRCLQALCQQTYPVDRYEVIVVDNNNTQDIKAVCNMYSAQASQRFMNIRYEFEGKQGAYAARNRGVRAAQGEIIAFTDADCLPSPQWILQGVKALQSVGLVAGHIELTFQQNCPNAFEYADSAFHLQQWSYAQQDYAATGNAFTWRWMFDAVGWFDENLSHLGDRHWGQRVHAAGYGVTYSPYAWVAHPARSTLLDLMRKVRFQARAMNSLKPYTGSALLQQLIPFGRRFYECVLGDQQPWILKLQLVAIAHLLLPSRQKIRERVRR